MMVFCRLVGILLWLWEDSRTTFTYIVIMTGSPQNLNFLLNRSVWLISGFILPLLEMDVRSKYGSLHPDI